MFFSRLVAVKEIAIGVETGNPELLGIYKRGAKADYYEIVEKAFQVINSSEIFSNAFVMIDGPGETESDFWQLYEFLKKVNPSSVSWSFYNPLALIGLFKENRSPSEFGFYGWPFGYSQMTLELVVQNAMILSGTWWNGWKLNEQDPYFQNESVFGVNFVSPKIRITQGYKERSLVGDLWRVWQEEDIN